MLEEIKEVFSRILEKVYPSDITCFLCGRELSEDKYGLCDSCAREIEYNDKFCLKCGSPCRTMTDYCVHCQKQKRTFKLARAPLVYSGNISLAIQKYKYEGERHLAKNFARFMKDEFDQMKKEGIEIDIMVYVPLFKKRQRKRGFNQAERLARELSKLTNIPLSHNNLLRIKNTATQINLTFKERQENLDNAFMINNRSEFKNKNILLIDDVLTTGATVDHCAEIIKKAKAKNVYVLTFATTDAERA